MEMYEHREDDELVETINLAADASQRDLVERAMQQFRQQWPWQTARPEIQAK